MIFTRFRSTELSKTYRGATMNSEQILNNQELQPKDYTKVYGGVSDLQFEETDRYSISPVEPLKPKKPDQNLEV